MAEYLVVMQGREIPGGRTWKYMELPADLEEAFAAVNEHVYEWNGRNDTHIEFVDIILSTDVHSAGFEKFLAKHLAEQAKAELEEIDVKEHEEYERLRKKYEGIEAAAEFSTGEQ